MAFDGLPVLSTISGCAACRFGEIRRATRFVGPIGEHALRADSEHQRRVLGAGTGAIGHGVNDLASLVANVRCKFGKPIHFREPVGHVARVHGYIVIGTRTTTASRARAPHDQGGCCMFHPTPCGSASARGHFSMLWSPWSSARQERRKRPIVNRPGRQSGRHNHGKGPTPDNCFTYRAIDAHLVMAGPAFAWGRLCVGMTG
jgi:hypothetical protein